MSQPAFSIDHVRWPDEPPALTGELARLALMSDAWDDMAASIGTPAFDDAHARFLAAKGAANPSTLEH
jgi:hypothetical protein